MRPALMDARGVILVTLAADRTEDFVFQDFGESDDGIERGSELVAHRCQKLRFRLVARRRSFKRPGEIFRRGFEVRSDGLELLDLLAQRLIPTLKLAIFPFERVHQAAYRAFV